MALGAERERLRVARELHDSLAKTVEGLAMSASVLPAPLRARPERGGRARVAALADDARQAALEARVLMSDLRPAVAPAAVAGRGLRGRAAGFAERARACASRWLDQSRPATARAISTAGTHELLRILGEALANAVRHGRATHLAVALRLEGDALVL